jgi:glycosyltransferase involved in cell wall biosynthesis
MPSCRTSVALATCEGARFVDAQLESLVEQTRRPDELVVTDDASSDDTVARVEAFAERAPFPVRIERNPERLGTTANFERAVSLCGGDVVLLADQDDVWLPGKIEALAGVLEDRADVGLVFCNGIVVDADDRPLGYDLWRTLFFGARDRRRVRSGEAPAVFARRVVAAGTTLAFRRRFAPLLHPFPRLPSTHDAWIAFVIAAVAPCALVEAHLVRYRLHGQNQIGLRRLHLREQLAQARRQIARGAFAEDVAFFELARARLAGAPAGFTASPDALRVIDEKIAHARARDALPAAWLARWPVVARELLRGRYHRYGYGLRSVAQDLFLR